MSFSLTQMYGFVQVILIASIIILLSPMVLARMKVAYTEISVYFFFYVLILGVYGLFLGVIFGIKTEITLINSKIYFFYPIVGLLIAFLVKSFCSLKFIRAVIYTSATLILLINSAAVTQFFSGVELLPASVIKSGMLTFSFYEGRFLSNALNIASIPLLLPFLIYYVSYNEKAVGFPHRGKRARLFQYLILVLFVLFIIFTGRRGIWLTSLVSIIASYIVLTRSKGIIQFSLRILCLSVAAVCALIYFDVFNFYADEFDNQSERSVQGVVLLEAFYDSPFGNGIGSAFSVVRNENSWIYELTWHKLLADVGIFLLIFVIVFSFVLIFNIVKSGKLIEKRERDFRLFSLIGFFSVLLASATNPYILNLDGFIALGFLLGIIDGGRDRTNNASLLESRLI